MTIVNSAPFPLEHHLSRVSRRGAQLNQVGWFLALVHIMTLLRYPPQRALRCVKCRVPMLWIGLIVSDDGGAVFHYKCEKCGRIRTKTFR